MKMTHYWLQPRDRIFVKGYLHFCLAKNISKNISKSLSGNYNQKLIDHAKQSTTDAFKTASKRSNSKQSKSNWWFDW